MNFFKCLLANVVFSLLWVGLFLLGYSWGVGYSKNEILIVGPAVLLIIAMAIYSKIISTFYEKKQEVDFHKKKGKEEISVQLLTKVGFFLVNLIPFAGIFFWIFEWPASVRKIRQMSRQVELMEKLEKKQGSFCCEESSEEIDIYASDMIWEAIGKINWRLWTKTLEEEADLRSIVLDWFEAEVNKSKQAFFEEGKATANKFLERVAILKYGSFDEIVKENKLIKFFVDDIDAFTPIELVDMEEFQKSLALCSSIVKNDRKLLRLIEKAREENKKVQKENGA